MGVGSCMKDVAVSTCLEYDTPKIVHMRTRVVGVLNRVVQLAIILYVVVYIFIMKKGYQHIDAVAVSGTTTKLKGVAYTTAADDPRVGERLWDAADLNVPPEENGAFFLTTNVIVTDNQEQGVCTEPEDSRLYCKNDSDCAPAGVAYHLGHGVSAGECNTTAGMCKVRAWCPIEDDSLPANGKYAMLNQTKNFTVFVKNHVFFPYYNKTRSNLLEFIDKSYLRCQYHHKDHQYCPIFRLQDIVSIASTKASGNIQYDDKYYEALAIKGGVISISIKWDCNFDYDESECVPMYHFDRLDVYKGNTLASGYNFRYPIYYVENGTKKRQLVKAYGILFTLNTNASARAFDPVTFFLNVGSGLALLGIASVCCDICLLYFHRKKSYFKNHIFLDLTNDNFEETDVRSIDLERSDTDNTGCLTAGNGSQTNLTRLKMNGNAEHHSNDVCAPLAPFE